MDLFKAFLKLINEIKNGVYKLNSIIRKKKGVKQIIIKNHSNHFIKTGNEMFVLSWGLVKNNFFVPVLL